MRRTAAIVGVVIALLAAMPAAVAEQRLALVIGNDHYPNLSADRKLDNAVNDARAMAETLKVLGFDILGGAEPGRAGENLSRNDTIDRLGQLASRVQPGDIVFFFFAGHGVSLKGANILLPSDIPAPLGLGVSEEDRYIQRGIAEGDIIEQLTKLRAKAVILALDACRNNPITSGERSVGGPRGFLQTRLEVTPGAFFFSIYSAGYGQSAMDRLGPSDQAANSVFTRVFVESLRQPGLHIQDIASRTRKEVRKLTLARGYDQFLAYMDQLDDPIYLAGLPAQAVLTRQAQDKQLLDGVQAQLSKAATDADKSALPMGSEQLRLVLADAATSRAPAKRAALQMIADGGVEEGAQALEDYAREETRFAATLKIAEREQNASTAQSWREAGAIWRFKSVNRAIENYERALYFEPGDFWTNVELARLYRNSGRIADAQTAVQRLAPRGDEPIRVIVAAKETGDVLIERGDLEGAFRQFDLAVRTWEAAGQPDLRETGIIYRGTVPWTWRGDVLLRRGRKEEALRDQRRTLDRVKEVAAQQPDNAQAQRALSIGLERVGDVLVVDRNDLAGAMAAYEEELAINRRLAALDADNALAKRAVSISLEKFGDVLHARNDPAGAMKAYEEGLAIRRRLAALDSDNAQAQREVSIGLERVGDVLRERNDLAGAMKAYEEKLAIDRRLVALDANNAQSQRDLSLSLTRIGVVLHARNDLAGAMKAYEEGLAIARRLAALDANNAQSQRDLFVGLSRIGVVLHARNDLAGAMKAYEEGLAIARRLAALDPDNAQARNDLSWSLAKVQETADAMKAHRTLESDSERPADRRKGGRK